MTNLNPEFCRKVKEARRKAGLSQSELAAEVGCKQSALSTFENRGDGTKLNDEVIERLARRFNLEIVTLEKGVEAPCGHTPVSISEATVQAHTGFCPNQDCPGHHRYQVDDRVYLRPDRASQDPVGGRFCAICGEVLERRCPNCGSPVHDGAICSFCGEPYVTV